MIDSDDVIEYYFKESGSMVATTGRYRSLKALSNDL